MRAGSPPARRRHSAFTGQSASFLTSNLRLRTFAAAFAPAQFALTLPKTVGAAAHQLAAFSQAAFDAQARRAARILPVLSC